MTAGQHRPRIGEFIMVYGIACTFESLVASASTASELLIQKSRESAVAAHSFHSRMKKEGIRSLYLKTDVISSFSPKNRPERLARRTLAHKREKQSERIFIKSCLIASEIVYIFVLQDKCTFVQNARALSIGRLSKGAGLLKCNNDNPNGQWPLAPTENLPVRAFHCNNIITIL